MRKIIAISALSILSFPQIAQAEYTIEQYQELKDDKVFSAYVEGYVRGLLWANVNIKHEGLPPLFCPPPKMVLTVDNSIQLLDGYLAEHKKIKSGDMEMHMVRALRDAFPCR